jgi:hypothetical protein
MTSKDEDEAGTSGSVQQQAPSRTEQAKALLARYGSAYLITSISLALVSFTLCYLAVDAGKEPQGCCRCSRLGMTFVPEIVVRNGTMTWIRLRSRLGRWISLEP